MANLRIAATYEYQPEWEPIQSDPPVTVVLRHLTEDQREAAIEEAYVAGGTRTTVNYSALVRLAVVSISNLSINDQPITTGKQLTEQAGVVPLIQELGGQIAASFLQAASAKN